MKWKEIKNFHERIRIQANQARIKIIKLITQLHFQVLVIKSNLKNQFLSQKSSFS